ncbi:Alanine aminotransferase [Carpediemonas membranifera]|uniref:Alanine aminotransferase n=1 Tax=Carpediemonas membranifera TaxID=201153 RepID=A0A8J6AX85_9EUKA|nr:Alanine aminotransferase [Carpediemonas membranifera]|eukprot:KAG9394760.1 Alanine aminotransferase [Carpediemonas membranifera]
MSTLQETNHSYKKLTVDSISKKIVAAQYSVRGAVPLRANEIKEDLKAGKHFPFSNVVSCNIGNPQALQQLPLSFLREVAALVVCPTLLNHPLPFDDEVLARAKAFLKANPTGLGAYTHSQGFSSVRGEVAAFIGARDGHPTDPASIYLTNGASEGVKMALSLVCADSESGVMIPMPQYPLYSASLALTGARAVSYALCEEEGWSTRVEDLEASYCAAVDAGTKVTAIAVINPGNPTGGVLTGQAIADILEWAYAKNLVVLADEVYQENIYVDTKRFVSFKKVLRTLESQDKCLGLQLFSFHSTSKGFLGECGLRGGYMEIINLDPAVIAQVYKLASINLCPNTLGQLAVSLMVNPPQGDSPAAKVYRTERDSILDSLKSRAARSEAMFNSIEGVSCQPVEGALYAFPKLTLPAKLIEAAEAVGQAPDLFYCMAMLDAIGVCVVPGSGFNQVEGTWHFRTTVLPSGEQFEQYLRNVPKFHREFMARFQ